MIYISVLSFVFFSAGTVLLLDLNAGRVANDIESLFPPEESLRERALFAQKRKKRPRFPAWIIHVKKALESSGRESGFGRVCLASIALASAGAVAAIIMKNWWIMPVLAAAGAFVPFFAAYGSIEAYDRRLEEELETALSIITSTYIRTEDIVESVRQNLPNIKPPVAEIFSSFVTRATLLSSNLPACIRSMCADVDNIVFYEWCETLVACQDDASCKYTLLPVVNKLTGIRLVNSEMTTLISSCRREYGIMVLLLAGNVPLLYLINRDWFNALIHTTAGQIATAVCGIAVIVTAALMRKYTKPIDYRSARGEGAAKDGKERGRNR